MLTYNDLKVGTYFVLDGEPYEVMQFDFLRMQQRKPVAKTKIKNLFTGKIVERNFHQNENFEEAEIERKPVMFLYSHRSEFWFTEKSNPKERFMIPAEKLGEQTQFYKPNSEVTAFKFGEKIINIAIPVKMEFKITEVPPGAKGDTQSGGTKVATIETGAKVSVPLFINEGEVIRINTETGEYVERVGK